jgi:hypothetical protein
MVITQPSPDTLSIKTKSTTITIRDGVTIGSYTVPGAGEYDISGIQCTAQYLPEGVIFFLNIEDVIVTYLSFPHPESMKIDDASDSQILVVNLRSDTKPETLKPIIKALEPAYVYLLNHNINPAIAEELALPKEQVPNLKVTATGLPEEGTTVIFPG